MIPSHSRSVGELIQATQLPEILSPIQEVFTHLLSKVFYTNYNAYHSADHSVGHHQLDITFFSDIELPLGAKDGLVLAFNPDKTENQTVIPMELEYRLDILRYLSSADLATFNGTPRAFFNLLLDIFDIVPEDLLEKALEVFGVERDILTTFIQDTENYYGISLGEIDNMVALIDILQQQNRDLLDLIFNIRIDLENPLEKIQQLFSDFLSGIALDNVLNLFVPKIHATLGSPDKRLSLALAFPRKWLIPVDENGEPLPSNEQFEILFNAGLVEFSSENGFRFSKETSFDLKKCVIGTTGLILEFKGVKLDLSRTSNIPEADEAGYPVSFVGAYLEGVTIEFPKWWKDNGTGKGSLVGRDVLVGTGGFSGTLALEAADGTEPFLDTSLGGWNLKLDRFDITFLQNRVTDSNIQGQLALNRFKSKEGQDAVIEIEGHYDEDGNFSIAASKKDGFGPLVIPSVMEITVRSLEIGSEDGTFYVEMSCQILLTNAIMKSLLGEQKLDIPKLRIYADGSLEIVGGAIPIPKNLNLNLGPVSVAVTGINYGSHQEEHGGVMRKFQRLGFDGAIGLGPLGVEARGKGMQYFFTVDDKPFYSYFRMDSIEVDLIIPGTAKPEQATAIIQGYLSLPDNDPTSDEKPKEFRGGVTLKLPKARITGAAQMRLQPKHPAFLVDANISLPKPIPLASTNLGFHGFRGLLGYRYVADKSVVGADTWYDYYNTPPRGVNIDKFAGPEATQGGTNPISVGAGASISTLTPGDRIFSARLFLLLSLPNVFILEGRASILAKRLGLDDAREPLFHAFLAYGPDSVEASIAADYKLPQKNGWIIDLSAPLKGGFFFNNPSAWYLNFGTPQQPVQSRLLSLFNAQSFLSLSGRGIELGAKGEFKFDDQFGPAKVKARLYAEVGGRLSLDRPQLGGHLAVGGMADVKVWFIHAGVSVDAILAVEAARPFLILAKLRVCAKVRIGIFKVKVCVNVKLKWEKSKRVDRSPIAPLLPERAADQVKGVHMLTGDTFPLAPLFTDPATATHPGAPSHAQFDAAVIPLDTYIDVQLSKNVLPEAVSRLGGVNNPAEEYTDLIPPQRTVRGGREVRQVKHRYSIEAMEIKAWVNNDWKPYHPYEALLDDVNEQDPVDLAKVKFGSWQKNGKQYNAFRLLASSPFSYTEKGEPGWFLPEQIGITAATLFCEGQRRTTGCATWETKRVTQQYRTHKPFGVQGASFTLSEGGLMAEELILPPGNGFGFVSTQANAFGFRQSLAFYDQHTLSARLSEPSVKASLKLTSAHHSITVKWLTSTFEDTAEVPVLTVVHEQVVTPEQLAQPVVYDNPEVPVSVLQIIPNSPARKDADALAEAMEALYQDTYVQALLNGEETVDGTTPQDAGAYADLLSQQAALLNGAPAPSTQQLPVRSGKIRAQLLLVPGADMQVFDPQCGQLFNVLPNGFLSTDEKIARFEELLRRIKDDPSIVRSEPQQNRWMVTNRVVNQLRIDSPLRFDTETEAEAEAKRVRQVLLDHEMEIAWQPCDQPALARTPYFNYGYQLDTERLVLNHVATNPKSGYVLVGKTAQNEGVLLSLAENGYVRKTLTVPASSPYSVRSFASSVKTGENTSLVLGIDNAGDYSLSHIANTRLFLFATHQYGPGEANPEHKLIGLGGTQGVLALNSTVVKVATDGSPLAAQDLSYAGQPLSIVALCSLGDSFVAVGHVAVGPGNTVSVLMHLSDTLALLSTQAYAVAANQQEAQSTLVTQMEYVDGTLVLAGTGQWDAAAQVPFITTMQLTSQEDWVHQATSLLNNNPGGSIKIAASEEKVFATLTTGPRQELYRFSRAGLAFEWVKTMESATTSFDLMGASSLGLYGIGSTEGAHWLASLNEEAATCQFEGPTQAPLLTAGDWIADPSVSVATQATTLSPQAQTVQGNNLQATRIDQCPGWFDTPYPDSPADSDTAGNTLDRYLLLHEVCWESVEDYFYNQKIPSQAALAEDFRDGVSSVSRTVSPVWRPNTDYLLHFRLKDTVDDGASSPGEYNYYYGFRTQGPIGHTPAAAGTNALAPYIDYRRSYPNADGNLLNAKPLYYSGAAGNNTLWLYFTQPHVYHMVQDWPQYGGLAALAGKLQIVIKDPTEDVSIPNPPPTNAVTEEIPGAATAWESDQDPRMPADLRMMKALVSANEELNCMVIGGDPIMPRSYVQTVKLKNLKPSKMYTALVNNVFEGATRQVHSYVFQTSRYADLQDQVNSFVLDRDPDGNVTATATYNLPLPDTAQSETALNIAQVASGAAGISPSVANQALAAQYVDPLDRALEGALDLKPLPAAVTTEVNVLRTATGSPVGILVRSPEPFNDPKLDAKVLRDSLVRLLPNGTVDTQHATLYAQDYAQALLLPLSGTLATGEHTLRFRYQRWNGHSYTTEEATLTLTVS